MDCWSSFGVGSKIQPTPHFIQKGSLNGLIIGIKSYWSNCLSIAAIICSVVAICVSLPSAPELGIDYIGVIVGILSLLVTMLIGWQIWNTIAIEKKIKKEFH